MLEEYYIGELHEDDRTGSTDRGAKSWGASPAAVEEERSDQDIFSKFSHQVVSWTSIATSCIATP